MFRRREAHAQHMAKVTERLRLLAVMTPLAQADAAVVETRILRLNYGHRKDGS